MGHNHNGRTLLYRIDLRFTEMYTIYTIKDLTNLQHLLIYFFSNDPIVVRLYTCEAQPFQKLSLKAILLLIRENGLTKYHIAFYSVG